MQSTTKANKKISSARIFGAQKKPAVSLSSSFELEAKNVAPSEVEDNEASKKVSPPATPLTLEGWGLTSYSSLDDEASRPSPPSIGQ
jgi:hypothetical protein